jgi:hypothetical protein
MSFLIFGTTWFWILFALATILVIFATEKGSGIGATVTLIVTIALLFFFGNKGPLKDFFNYTATKPWAIILISIGYIIFGTCWAIVKWYFFLIKERDQAIKENHNFITIPKVSEHKSEIMVWMFYWPFSALWTILDHPVKKVFLFIYGKIRDRMQLMADKIFEPITREQRKREQEREADIENRRRNRSGI